MEERKLRMFDEQRLIMGIIGSSILGVLTMFRLDMDRGILISW